MIRRLSCIKEVSDVETDVATLSTSNEKRVRIAPEDD